MRHRLTGGLTGFWREDGKALTDKRTRSGRDPVLDENRQLKELAGQQALIIEVQKKLAGILGR